MPSTGHKRPAVFLDRDGVLIADVDLLADAAQIRILPGVPEALAALAGAGRALVVVTNQTVVARGRLQTSELDAIHDAMRRRLREEGAPQLDGIYVCLHHPNATLEAYRVDCDCRKPKPGLILRAADELGLDLEASTIVGDRLSDVAAGALAGCSTVLVHSGAHRSPPIETTLELGAEISPDFECADLPAAVDWIVSGR